MSSRCSRFTSNPRWIADGQGRQRQLPVAELFTAGCQKRHPLPAGWVVQACIERILARQGSGSDRQRHLVDDEFVALPGMGRIPPSQGGLVHLGRHPQSRGVELKELGIGLFCRLQPAVKKGHSHRIAWLQDRGGGDAVAHNLCKRSVGGLDTLLRGGLG